MYPQPHALSLIWTDPQQWSDGGLAEVWPVNSIWGAASRGAEPGLLLWGYARQRVVLRRLLCLRLRAAEILKVVWAPGILVTS